MQADSQMSFSIDHGITVQSFGSSSSGNAFLVTSGAQVVMVDCGIGIRTIQRGLKERGLSLNDVQALCITHEHSDHICTLPKVLREDLCVVATQGTASRSIGRHPNRMIVKAFTPVTLGEITIWPLKVSHDAAEPTGFMFEFKDGSRATILTDLGVYTDDLTPYLQASDFIILEANYDEHMLRTGPYPRYLQERVRSNRGHLANTACGEALTKVLSGDNREPVIRLAHLSEHNNVNWLAEQTVNEALTRIDLELDVRALPRKEIFDTWESHRSVNEGGFLPASSPIRNGQLALEM